MQHEKARSKKCRHLRRANGKFKVVEMALVCKKFKSDAFFIQALWLHYQNVSHPIPCSCPLKPLHLPNTCQIILHSLRSDVMNTQ